MPQWVHTSRSTRADQVRDNALIAEAVDVELGSMPLEHAKTLLVVLERAVEHGSLWDRDDYTHAVSLKAMLTYRIAKAEKVATFSEPG